MGQRFQVSVKRSIFTDFKVLDRHVRKHILLSTVTGPTGDSRGKLTLTCFLANRLKKTWHGNILNLK